jgi:hypothetical protein
MTQMFQVEKAQAPAALIAFPCKGWVKLTDTETGDTAIAAVLHRSGHIQIPLDASKSDYGNVLTPADCRETINAANAFFA